MGALTTVLCMVLPLGAAATSCGTGAEALVEVDAEDEQVVVEGSNEFGLVLYSMLAERSPEGNLFLSPYSISSALAIAWAGAEGETQQQMAEVLGLILPEEEVHSVLARIREKLSTEYRRQYLQGEGDPLTLEVANALWVQERYELLQSYVDLVRDMYDAEARNLDFSGDTEGARQTINSWVEERTRERIVDLIPQGMLDPSTKLVITNAVYFMGSWAESFPEAATTEREFLVTPDMAVPVPMMSRQGSYPYAEVAGCRAVELPYADNQSSMVVLLPEGDISELESALSVEMLDEVLSSLSSTEVALTMPTFEFTSSFGLADVLRAMGMERAFAAESADFSGITGGPDLFISEVLHKAFVKVDEQGTEAAAATAVIMLPTSAAMPPPEPVVLVLDRPFLFLIRDRLTGAVLFMGRMADPS